MREASFGADAAALATALLAREALERRGVNTAIDRLAERSVLSREFWRSVRYRPPKEFGDRTLERLAGFWEDERGAGRAIRFAPKSELGRRVFGGG